MLSLHESFLLLNTPWLCRESAMKSRVTLASTEWLAEGRSVPAQRTRSTGASSQPRSAVGTLARSSSSETQGEKNKENSLPLDPGFPTLISVGPMRSSSNIYFTPRKGKLGSQKTAVSTCGSPADKEGLNHPEIQRQGRVNTSWEVSHLLGVYRRTPR